MRDLFLLSLIILFASILTASVVAAEVEMLRLPKGGYQPQVAVDGDGVLHAIYATGDVRSADIFYIRSDDAGRTFSEPMRVNSQAGSAIPAGSVRGAHMAIGRGGRVHVAWMGSDLAEPKGPDNATPMIYTRLNNAGNAFEAQRNVLQHAVGLDGGGTVGADEQGRVYVAWHAGGGRDETQRRIWLARSEDDGDTFGREVAVDTPGTGVCVCCGMTALASSDRLWLGYRTATERVNRDMRLLGSLDGGQTFTTDTKVHAWKLQACPMSTASLAVTGEQVLVAWETEGQVYLARYAVDGTQILAPIAAPGTGDNRKHPRLAVNGQGQILLVWTEGTGWNRGGSLAWQVFDSDGQPVDGASGHVRNVPAGSFAAPIARPNKSFAILY